MSDETPDLAGFRAAQSELREKTGQDVVLLTPLPSTFPDGTPMDPETGKPYDPFLLATASGFASAVIRAGFAFRGLARSGSTDATEMTPLGITEKAHAMLIVGSGDADVMESATDVIVMGERWKVDAVKPDIAGNVIHRYLAYLKRR